MPPKLLPPPPTYTHPHLTATLAPSAAESLLTTFLSLTATKPHLHPDSLLSTAGVQFPPTSGPSGGLALHHLRRIAQGIGGENLVPETREDLARFYDDDVGGEEKEGEDMYRAEGGGGKRKRAAIEEWAEDTSESLNAATGPGTPAEVESMAGVAPQEWQDQGELDEHDGAMSKEDKAARKEAKAARKLAKRQEKAKAAG